MQATYIWRVLGPDLKRNYLMRLVLTEVTFQISAEITPAGGVFRVLLEGSETEIDVAVQAMSWAGEVELLWTDQEKKEIESYLEPYLQRIEKLHMKPEQVVSDAAATNLPVGMYLDLLQGFIPQKRRGQ